MIVLDSAFVERTTLMRLLTKTQVQALASLEERPRSVSDACKIIDWTYDRLHSSFRRLEDQGCVRRLGTFPEKWELTRLGRRTLDREATAG